MDHSNATSLVLHHHLVKGWKLKQLVEESNWTRRNHLASAKLICFHFYQEHVLNSDLDLYYDDVSGINVSCVHLIRHAIRSIGRFILLNELAGSWSGDVLICFHEVNVKWVPSCLEHLSLSCLLLANLVLCWLQEDRKESDVCQATLDGAKAIAGNEMLEEKFQHLETKLCCGNMGITVLEDLGVIDCQQMEINGGLKRSSRPWLLLLLLPTTTYMDKQFAIFINS